jgi:hypothetical protein
MMPPQLARALQRCKPRRKGSTKPVVETLPCFNVNELLDAIPRKYGIIRTQSFTSSSHPPIIGLRLACDAIEVTHKNGNIQNFTLKWIRTYFGRPRPAIRCDKCQRAFIKLYNLHGDLACKHCRGAIYLSQKITPTARPTLRAHRLARFLELKTNINKRTQERLLRKYGEKAMRPQSNYQTSTPRHWK